MSFKLLSDRVKKIKGSNLSTDRYDFLRLEEAEPDLGNPSSNNSFAASEIDGTRKWVYPDAGLTVSGNQVTVDVTTISIDSANLAYATSNTLFSVIDELDNAISQAVQGSLSSVVSDATLSGDGSTGSPLSVVDYSHDHYANNITNFTESVQDVVGGFVAAGPNIELDYDDANNVFTISATNVTGYTGSRGYTGSQGNIGYTGSQGPIGYTGSQGIQGVQGVIGYTGSQGVIGYTGSQGIQGYTGSTGPIAGTDGQLIYNNGGISGGTSQVIFNNTSNSLEFNSTFGFDGASTTLSTTTETVIASFSATTYGGGKFVISAKDGVNRHIVELLVAHDGSTAVATQYGDIYTNEILATYNVDISSGNVRILATGESANSTVYRVQQTLMFA